MANPKLYFVRMMDEEGGYVNDKDDAGKATKYGVTLAQWQAVGYDKDGDGIIDAVDIKLLTPDDAYKVMYEGFWKRWQADKIEHQVIAEFLVDFTYNAGAWGVKIPQRVLRLEEDGKVGKLTLEALNKAIIEVGPKALLEKFKAARIKYYNDIVRIKPKWKKFLKGWINRTNRFKI